MLFTFTTAVAVMERNMAYTADVNQWRGPVEQPYRPHLFENPWHPGWIALTVLGFIFWWPVGLAILFYMIGSGRVGCFGRRRRAWQAQNGGQSWDWRTWACGAPGAGASSGNHAFDEYKAETLRRLEDEQKEF